MIAGSNQVGEEAEVGGSVTVGSVSSAVWEQGERAGGRWMEKRKG